MSADDVATFNGSLCGTEGGYRCIVDGNNIEVDGVGDRAALTVINEVVKEGDAVEVVVWGECVLVVLSVVGEFTIGDGEVNDLELVNIARGDVSVVVVNDVRVGYTSEEISW